VAEKIPSNSLSFAQGEVKMAIKEKIQEDMKTAMRSQDKERLATIRLVLAAIKQREVDERIELSDEQVLATLNKMIKQRRESITQFEAGNRADLAAKELAEINVIQVYLPAQMSPAEIEQAVAGALAESGATSAKDMGKVMGILKAKLQGKADMTLVSAKVKEKLS
jgi:uncharacterized protein YqeY